jgi:hypothetical protein
MTCVYKHSTRGDSQPTRFYFNDFVSLQLSASGFGVYSCCCSIHRSVQYILYEYSWRNLPCFRLCKIFIFELLFLHAVLISSREIILKGEDKQTLEHTIYSTTTVESRCEGFR